MAQRRERIRDQGSRKQEQQRQAPQERIFEQKQTFKASEEFYQLYRSENPPIFALHGAASMASRSSSLSNLYGTTTPRVLRNRGGDQGSSISAIELRQSGGFLTQCVEHALGLISRKFRGKFLDAQLTQARHATKSPQQFLRRPIADSRNFRERSADALA